MGCKNCFSFPNPDTSTEVVLPGKKEKEA